MTMTKVYNLAEIVSAIPQSNENPRRFNVVSDQMMLVDLDKVLAARTFNGLLVYPSDDESSAFQKPAILVDLFFEGGFTTTTVFDGNVRDKLLGSPRSGRTPAEEYTNWINDGKYPGSDDIPYNNPHLLEGTDNPDKNANINETGEMQ